MNDDDVSVRAEAASAYLDGELDAAERASVASDPETMAVVESFTRLRQALGEPGPVADDVRAAALSAALAQFDVRQTIGVTAAKVTRLHPRWQRANRVLGGVAAAAVIALIGIALVNNKGTDMKSSASATLAAADDATPPQIEMATGSAAPAGGATGATTAAAATVAGLPAASSKMAVADLPAINSEAELAQYASSFVDATTSQAPVFSASPPGTEMVRVPALPPASCLASTDTVLGPISVFGAPAWAVRDCRSGHRLQRLPPAAEHALLGQSTDGLGSDSQ
jgi:hypothetical protein